MALQERYSEIVLAKLRAESVFAPLFNTTYQGTPTAGAVKIPVRSEATVKTYDVAAGITANVPATTFETLTIDNEIAVNELCDGYEAAAVPDGLIAERLDSAGFAMADYVDNALADIVEAGTEFTTSKTGTYKIIAAAVQKAKKAKVKVNEMWLAVSNDFAEEIITSDEFIKASNLGDDVMQNGLIGRIAGVPVYESCNLEKKFVLGNKTFCHFVSEWSVPVALNDLHDGVHIGASAVQGRRVYGAKISRPETVLVYNS